MHNYNYIFFILIIFTVYFTGKLAVKKIINNTEQIRAIIRDAVIDGLSIFAENNKNK